MKKIFILVALSFLVGFMVVIVQLFTRTVTLDGVREIDFNLIYNLIDNEELLSSQNISNGLNSLRDGEIVLFPMAVLTGSTCLDNSMNDKSKSICARVKDASAFEKYLQNKDIDLVKDKKFVNDSNEYFMFKNFTSIDGYLVGHAGKYILAQQSGFSKFFYFLSQEVVSLISFHDKRVEFYRASYHMWVTIIIISILLSYLYIRRSKHNLNRYKLLKSRQTIQKKEWKLALEEQQNIQYSLIAKEHEIAQKLLEAQQTPNKTQLKSIDELNSSKDEILLKLEISEKTILNLESKEDKLLKTILDQSKRLATQDSIEANIEIYNKFNSLKKLWRVEPMWHERVKIESKIATEDGRTPFSITQAFISFDANIVQKAKTFGYKSSESEDLYGAINYLYNNNHINMTNKNIFHKIRIKRNNWFHNGVYPNKAIINKLLEILEQTKRKPIL